MTVLYDADVDGTMSFPDYIRMVLQRARTLEYLSAAATAAPMRNRRPKKTEIKKIRAPELVHEWQPTPKKRGELWIRPPHALVSLTRRN